MQEIFCNTLKRNIFDDTNEMSPITCKKYYAILWKKYSSMMPPIICKKYYAIIWKEISLIIPKWNATNTMQEMLCNTLKRNIFNTANNWHEYKIWKEISLILPMKCQWYHVRNKMQNI